ncbi:MAG: glycoside hydrolase family 125 protein [bacterium]|nr:glycoside hydrolase family 125 protein [bacterium]
MPFGLSALAGRSLALARSVAFALALLTDLPAAALAQAPPARAIEVPTHGGPTLTIDASVLFHTIASDFFLEDDGTVYVQTGDIPAMWLRDSAAQTTPYVRFAPGHPQIADTVRRVIRHNVRNVITDPYANAFTAAYKIWEQKWEVDSLAFPITLIWSYWERTHDRSIFNERLRWMLEAVVATYDCEQHHQTCSHYRYGELPNHGAGAAFAPTGMIWTGFRPSDDAAVYPFNIPQNMLAVVALHELAVLAGEGYRDQPLAEKALGIALVARQGIERYGRVYDMRRGWIYAYEVDGLGEALLAGDANLPNLISAAYFGYLSPDDPLYRTTRGFVLSSDDPYFFHGSYADGVGSAHTPPGWIWPLGIITRGLTASDLVETADAVRSLVATDGNDGLVHESFNPRLPWRFTRAEFGWANAMYAELIFRTAVGMREEHFMPQTVPALFPSTARTPVLAGRTTQWRNRAALERVLREMFR